MQENQFNNLNKCKTTLEKNIKHLKIINVICFATLIILSTTLLIFSLRHKQNTSFDLNKHINESIANLKKQRQQHVKDMEQNNIDNLEIVNYTNPLPLYAHARQMWLNDMLVLVYQDGYVQFLQYK